MKLIASFPKSVSADIRVALQVVGNRTVADVRVWRLPAGGGKPFPTKAGMRLELSDVPGLVKALREAAKAAGGR